MVVKAIKIKVAKPKEQTIFELLDVSLTKLAESSIVAISSKVVALCEGRVVPINSSSKEELVRQEAAYYLPASFSKYGYRFTIKQRTLTSLAGIDESNGGENYILWPRDSQEAANQIRKYLKQRFKLKKAGVIITDSTCIPLRWGTLGSALGYSGFRALNNYVGKPDLFGKPFRVSQAGVAIGMAAAAVLVMGEGAEQTPIAVISDVPFVRFQDRNPTKEELELFYINNQEDDLFAPFLGALKWKRGKSA